MGREHFERGFEDQLALFLLDTGAARGWGVHVVRSPLQDKAFRVNWTNCLDQFLLGCGARFECGISASNPLTVTMAVLTFVHPVKNLRSMKMRRRPSVGRTETKQ
ncbi:hypothetical protein [Mesorhizobium amorphae]|uniref:hypothetical protein n=1 Tax=Mesorhizobium amorphae TaxID=71433 RepID=UPI001642E5A8|nr:hypothetical protein [Mesorhizobium amorphae]